MWKRSHGRTTKAPPDERGGQQICSPYSHRATSRLYPLSLTLLTLLTVFSENERIRITLLPDRPWRLNAISIPSARRNVCARRKWPARARGFFGQPQNGFGCRARLQVHDRRRPCAGFLRLAHVSLVRIVPRTYRDQKDLALLATQILKSRNFGSVVRMKDLQTGGEIVIAFRRSLASNATLHRRRRH